jgi:glycine/D-amino acid oxidase-like deaminating enzyme
VLTEPLTDAQLESIGWLGREGVEDFRDLVHYYRLTADNRLLIGGRDVKLGDGVGMDFDSDEQVWAALRQDVRTMFPGLADVQFSHAWGGPVSATLDMFPALGYLGGKDVIYSFGCVGHGVSVTHLNGQTITDLVLERESDLTDVFSRSRAGAWDTSPPSGSRTSCAGRTAASTSTADRPRSGGQVRSAGISQPGPKEAGCSEAGSSSVQVFTPGS